jgi:hypothetical protein
MQLPKQVKPLSHDTTVSRQQPQSSEVSPQACNWPGVCNLPGKQCQPCQGGQQQCTYGRYYCNCSC